MAEALQAPPSAPLDGLASSRYQQLVPDRESYLVRARRLALITVPSLFRESGANGTSDTPVTWQSFGAYCVNILSSKLSLSMFPPGVPWIRLNPSRAVLQDMAQLGDQQAAKLKVEMGKALGEAEKEFVSGIDEDGDIDRLTVANKHLVIGGNHAIQIYKDASIRGISFEHWVCIRDKAGNLLEFIIEDTLAWETLSPEVKAHCEAHGYSNKNRDPKKAQDPIRVYTRGVLEDGAFRTYQEAYSATVEGSQWVYDKDALPYIFIPFNLLDGESYGRGYVEDYEGDIQSLDGLEQTLTEGSAAAARYITLVRPGGVTSKTTLEQAANGAVITGDANDVHTLEAGKNADFQAAQQRLSAKEDRLAKAFLLNSVVQRSGERVTAEEIRFVAQELQDNLGGVYSSQVTWFQRPFALKKMAALQRLKRMTPLGKQFVRPMIVTGAAALGRNAERQALDDFVNVPPTMQQVAASRINPDNYMRRRATALGVDQEGLLYTDDEIAAQQQQAQQAEAYKAAAPNMVAQGGNLMATRMKTQSQEAIAAQAQQQSPDQGASQ